MAISVADNFSYQGAKPLDARTKFGSVEEMALYDTASLYDGCIAYVANVKMYYTFDSSNDVDTTTGKWREFKGGGGGDGLIYSVYVSHNDYQPAATECDTSEIEIDAYTYHHIYPTIETECDTSEMTFTSSTQHLEEE